MLTLFGGNFEIEERCKGVHCVDLGESFPTSIYLMKSASIQPRTSPSKFGGKFNSLFICLLNRYARSRYGFERASQRAKCSASFFNIHGPAAFPHRCCGRTPHQHGCWIITAAVFAFHSPRGGGGDAGEVKTHVTSFEKFR